MRAYYYERGIRVCSRWQGRYGFRNFLADMGHRPPDMTLDRIDVRKGYSPKNCRWATRQQQRNNRRDTKFYTYKGKTMCLTDWVREITGGDARTNAALRCRRSLGT